MALSNQQIERYSRQIIVSGIGGIGQERLLASHLVLAGDIGDLERVLAYMVGAGVGKITLRLTAGDTSLGVDALLERMHDLNREVSVNHAAADATDATLILALAGSAAALETIRALSARQTRTPTVFARLDIPARIALLPAPPPCLECADAAITGTFVRRGDNAGFSAMVAAAEAFSLLAQPARVEKAMLLEFNGYSSATREIHARQSASPCQCTSPAWNAPR
jgi:hypothetical protein